MKGSSGQLLIITAAVIGIVIVLITAARNVT